MIYLFRNEVRYQREIWYATPYISWLRTNNYNILLQSARWSEHNIRYCV